MLFKQFGYIDCLFQGHSVGCAVKCIQSAIYMEFGCLLYYFNFQETLNGWFSIFGTGLMLGVFFIISVMKYYVWLLIITFKLPLGKIIKNSFYFVFINLKNNLLIGLVSILWYALSVGICLLCMANAQAFILSIVIVLLLNAMFFPGFKHLLVQFCIFPCVKKHMIDPYYEQNPDADIELRKSLGLEVPEDDEDEGALDEHVWLSIKNAELFCRELAAGLKTANAANAPVYEKNENAYQKKLKALDEKYTSALTESDKKYDTLLFGDRFPFRYLVDDYNLKYYAAFAGCSADSEASFETIAFLANKLTELKLPAVLKIDGSDDKLAETIIDTSDFKDEQILCLNSMQAVTKEMLDSDSDYIGMMESNLDVLKTALAVEG